ncbi:MAG: YncE family protein, partial [Burkholderiales bacterium]
MPRALAALLLAAAAALLISQPAPPVRVGPQPGGGFLLHSGWTLTPAGRQIPLSTLPMSMALSPDGRLLYAANLFRNSVSVINPLTGFLVSEIPTGRRPYRIVFAPDGKTFYVSHWAESTVG